ncbi:XdhC family protein [Pseudomonas sp. MAFF 302030]|uniref:XdhC family protein n=1 Tax=Pseudomonas morbosilactucae TaxID=2938197 RepID=A0A9X1YXZ1_9PSED|nr:XdhC family protein [Pseudomonas morbosilactucae]MCK9799649.1 XdhC family protein [Pseudomonas morbosilactucae]
MAPAADRCRPVVALCGANGADAGFRGADLRPPRGVRLWLGRAAGSFCAGMPDEAVLAIQTDERTAIIALTHDPRLDDMALLTALTSRAFYVGALGSRVNSQKRRENLAALGLPAEAIGRLHGPIGLHIGSHTPAEIALSLMAEIVAIKNGVAAVQKKPLSEEA